MAEAFPQQESGSFEHRTGNIIRRRGGEHHHEKAERDYVFDYVQKYGDPSHYERGFGGKSFEHILGSPNTQHINEIAQQEGLIYCKQSKDGETLCFIKQSGQYHRLNEGAVKRYFELVKENQNKDSQNVPLSFPESLSRAISKKLSQKEEGENTINYYTSAGTALDHTHDIGADAFFEINGMIITLDLTLRADKTEGENLGADILIEEKDISLVHELNPTTEGEQRELAERAYEQQINALAERICDVYKNRIQKAV